ncbi:MSHA biogenesis protein MshK [Grimontia hollisae]|nr:MSHA biogenesis protein MshK [Grimontia hollisae]MDF2183408.1 MSHA biogenesis protein MshK [Grimontia hollisae]
MTLRNNSVLTMFVLLLPLTALANSDPTAPLGVTPSRQPTPKKVYRLPELDAVLCSADGHCSAVFNGKRTTQGQRINGYTVAQINGERVTLTRNGKRWALTVFNEQVVQ